MPVGVNACTTWLSEDGALEDGPFCQGFCPAHFCDNCMQALQLVT